MALVPFYPDGKVRLLKDVPLNNTYRDTYAFVDLSSQSQFFFQKTAFEFKTVAPVRYGESIRVPLNATQALPCSYMMFQNSNFSTKWFYAFITGVEWLSLNDCIINYEIDDIQTWFFDMEIPPCFVEREHVNNDAIGANIVPESLEYGEYIVNDLSRTNLFYNYDIIIAATVSKNGDSVTGDMYGGVYSGLEYLTFETAEEANDYIDKVTRMNKSNGIVAVFMMPSEFLAAPGSDKGITKSVSKPKNIMRLANGYVPRNKKLFTYPYNLLHVTTANGNSADFKYEFFEIDKSTGYGKPNLPCRFIVAMDTTPNPTAVLVPINYKMGSADLGDIENWEEKLSMDGFPQCAWATDAYKAWLAQNGSSNQLAIMSSAFNGITSFINSTAGGSPLGVASSLGNTAFSIANTLNQKTIASTMPPQAHGANSNTSLLSQQRKDFYFYNLTIEKEFARIIDDYFDMFGYAVHEVKVPNIKGREYWNFVQTKECKVKGVLPSPSARHIEDIFNIGIRFWHSDVIGEYYRNNRIIGGT